MLLSTYVFGIHMYVLLYSHIVYMDIVLLYELFLHDRLYLTYVWLYSHIGHMNFVFLHELNLRASLDLTFLLIYIHNYDMIIVFLVNWFVMIIKTALIYILFITFHRDRDFIIKNWSSVDVLAKLNRRIHRNLRFYVNLTSKFTF